MMSVMIYIGIAYSICRCLSGGQSLGGGGRDKNLKEIFFLIFFADTYRISFKG